MDNLTLDETIRGHILIALDFDPNGTLAITAISAVLQGASLEVTKPELKAHLDYLHDKELVKLEVKNKNVTWIKRTAKGKDLIDGRIEESGIIIPRGL